MSGYIPDFVLRGYKPIIVDVKPLVSWDDYWERSEEIREIGLIDEGYDVLIVGVSMLSLPGSANTSIGLLALEENYGFGYSSCMRCIKCGCHSFFDVCNRWVSVMCGHYDGNSYIGTSEMESKWPSAKNKVQWQPKMRLHHA